MRKNQRDKEQRNNLVMKRGWIKNWRSVRVFRRFGGHREGMDSLIFKLPKHGGFPKGGLCGAGL